MEIPINKDIDDYKESFWGVLTVKQWIYCFFALAVGAVITLTCYYFLHWNLTVAAYISIPFIIPIGLAGFFNKNGMGVKEFFIKFIQQTIKRKTYLYISYEGEEQIQQLSNAEEKKGIEKIMMSVIERKGGK